MLRYLDALQLAANALGSNTRRTLLIVLATAIGVSSVVLLASLGEGARRYVTGQFEALGTNLLVVLPGRSETPGGAPPMMSETPRDLTLEDAAALLRSSHIYKVAPLSVGAAPVSWPPSMT